MKPGLQLNFIENSSTVEARSQVIGKIDSILMMTTDGHDWDGLSDIGAPGLNLTFRKHSPVKSLRLKYYSPWRTWVSCLDLADQSWSGQARLK